MFEAGLQFLLWGAGIIGGLFCLWMFIIWATNSQNERISKLEDARLFKSDSTQPYMYGHISRHVNLEDVVRALVDAQKLKIIVAESETKVTAQKSRRR